MNAAPTKIQEPPLSPAQRNALLSLLADEDPAVFGTVRDRILAQGADAARWLREHVLSDDPVLRRRVLGILDRFEAQRADNDFLAFCLSHGEDLDIEQAALLLARTEYPGISCDGYRAWLDDLAVQLFERLDYSLEPDQIIGAINDFLFRELGFAGNEQNYYDPENSYLNRVLDQRTGNPINLCLLYLLLARRLRLPIAGIGMPGHFVCRFQSSTAELYIDVFNGGRLLSKGDCVKFLLQSSQGYHESHLEPVSSRRMLLRICMNLHHIYVQRGDAARANRLQRYLVALSN